MLKDGVLALIFTPAETELRLVFVPECMGEGLGEGTPDAVVGLSLLSAMTWCMCASSAGFCYEVGISLVDQMYYVLLGTSRTTEEAEVCTWEVGGCCDATRADDRLVNPTRPACTLAI